MQRALLFVLGLLGLCGVACSRPEKRADAGKTPGVSADITLFFTTELKGTVEPCGCNSNPLGDLARLAELIATVRKERPAALFDGGSTLYTEAPIPPGKGPQEELKADLLARTLPKLGLAAAGLGPYDLAGPRFPRQAANVTAGAPTERPRIIELGGARVGVFGVVDPSLVPGVTAGDPASAAQAAIAELRGQGAQVIVGLSHMSAQATRSLARTAPGIDLLIVGQATPDPPAPRPETAGTTTILTPANRGQSVIRVDLHLDAGGGMLVDAIGPERAAALAEDLEQRIAKLAKDLERWTADPNAERAFVDKNRDELARLRRERTELAEKPLRVPAKGSWFVLREVTIQRALPCDTAIVSAKQALDRATGEANRKAAADEKPIAPGAGRSGYSGIDECSSCHKAAVDFWRGTKHASAWPTLEAVGKQWNRDCISCHVTGWQEPGGSTLAVNESLRNVQCETCHGPASLHVDSDGVDRASIRKTPPAELCASRCHTPEHSDTFQHEAYLRDVTGPGHGAALRKRLGEGPTGHALRSAALETAGHNVGANCPK